MALIKTDYGLRYNDDGSLCMTVRQDDVPFPGVDSWAVEEGTTNLLDSLWSTAHYTAITPPDGFAKAGRITIGTSGSSFGYVGSQTNITAQSNTYYTLSYYARVVKGKNTLVNGTQIYIGSDSQGTQGVAIQQIYNELDYNWKRFVITGQTDGDATKLTRAAFRIQTDQSEECIVEIADWQLEKKPYATSFVDGTRAKGNLAVPVNPNDFTNFVAATWFKFNSTTSMYPRIFDFGTNTSTANGEWVTYVDNVANSLLIWGVDNSHGGGSLGFSQLEPGKWYFLVLTFDSPHFKGYLFLPDSTLITKEMTLSEWTPNTSKTKLFIGQNSTQVRALNGIVSNVYLGHYRDKNDNVIWTDDYIKYVYEQKKPFITPPTMPLE